VFGIGGGAVLVPVFYECFRLVGVPVEVRMPLCIGTSLAVIIPTSIRSFRAHYLRGAVRHADHPGLVARDRDRREPPAASSARYAPERLFKFVFVGVAWSAAFAAFARARGLAVRRRCSDRPVDEAVWPFLIGLLSTLMGVGGGLFSNLLMTFYGRPIHQAVATSSALAVLISIPV